jgi:hypothetical protein
MDIIEVDNNIQYINIDNWGIEDCVAFSINDSNNSVYILLNSNFLLDIIILYLLFNLIILLLADLVAKYNWKLLFF